MRLPLRPSSDRQEERPLVRVEGLGVRRSGRWLVHDVDLTIHRGEIVALIGPNGAGKTTTAKAILGIEAPSAGRVTVTPGTRIGYVPQRLAIDWTLPLTVRHLMTLTARHSRAAVVRALADLGAAHLIDAPVRHLSGGEFQRVLLARALIRTPDLLILDEPVQGVDFPGEVTLYGLIRGVRDRLDCGILLISHDLHVVMAETDMVVCLNEHVCCRGAPHAVAGSGEFQALFGPHAAQALAVYRHAHDHTHDDGHGHGHGPPAGNVVPLEPAADGRVARGAAVRAGKAPHAG